MDTPLYPAVPDLARALPNHSANKLSAGDRAAHDWYRFVLSFPPHLVREYLNRFRLGSDQTVLDPFCGTATTVVECKKLGVPSIGVEANPMAHFAGEVKTDWKTAPGLLVEHAQEIADSVRRRFASTGVDDDAVGVPDGMKLKTLPAELESLLLRSSVSPLPMHKILVLLDEIRRRSNEETTRHELLALAAAAVNKISNLHFGPEIGVGRIKRDAPVIEPWLQNVMAMAEDIRQLRPKRHVPARIFRHDSRDILSVVRPRSIDGVITSPPYPNEKDYSRTTRLESVLLGFIKSKDELRAFKKSLVRSNTRSIYKGDDDDRWIAAHPEVHRIADEIEARRIALGKTSGFERMYARVTKLYFGGMARHLAELRGVLRPGAKLAYVVGDQASYLRVMIRTGSLLGEIAEELGYRVESIDLFRTRIATATKEQLREEVVVLTWNGDSRRTR